LVPSVTPSDASASTQSPLDTSTTLETRIISSTPLITLTTLSDNITNEITPVEEVAESTEKIRITTLEPDSSEEVDDSSEEIVGVTDVSSEEPTESDEDETTTEPGEAEPLNLTSSTLIQSGNNTTPLITNFVNILFDVLTVVTNVNHKRKAQHS